MELDFYCLKNCDTCRKAEKALSAAGHQLHISDIRRDGVPRSVLQEALERLGRDVLLSTRSPSWKALSEAEKSRDLVDLMLEFPMLMKRPLILNKGYISAGWSKEVQADLV